MTADTKPDEKTQDLGLTDAKATRNLRHGLIFVRAGTSIQVIERVDRSPFVALTVGILVQQFV